MRGLIFNMSLSVQAESTRCAHNMLYDVHTS